MGGNRRRLSRRRLLETVGVACSVSVAGCGETGPLGSGAMEVEAQSGTEPGREFVRWEFQATNDRFPAEGYAEVERYRPLDGESRLGFRLNASLLPNGPFEWDRYSFDVRPHKPLSAFLVDSSNVGTLSITERMRAGTRTYSVSHDSVDTAGSVLTRIALEPTSEPPESLWVRFAGRVSKPGLLGPDRYGPVVGEGRLRFDPDA